MTDTTSRDDSDLFERLAAIEHQRWAHWQRYLHDKAVRQADGGLLLPAELVARWERLIETPYADLSEPEKNSDRDQVLHYWALICPEAASPEPASRRGRSKLD